MGCRYEAECCMSEESACHSVSRLFSAGCMHRIRNGRNWLQHKRHRILTPPLQSASHWNRTIKRRVEENAEGVLTLPADTRHSDDVRIMETKIPARQPLCQTGNIHNIKTTNGRCFKNFVLHGLLRLQFPAAEYQGEEAQFGMAFAFLCLFFGGIAAKLSDV